MKRFVRVVSLLMAVLICLSLCGCQKLDEMRARHGVWQEDGTILWNDAVYKMLPEVNFAEYNESYGHSVFITEPDVPVLLSEDYSYHFSRDEEGVLMYGRAYEDNDGVYRYGVFCRSDLYDTYAAICANGFETKGVCYDYYNRELGEGETYYLTAEQEYAFNYIVSNSEPGFQYTYETTSGWYELMLFAYSDKDLYRQELCTLYYDGYDIYISNYDLLYRVPDDYKVTFYDIIRAGYENESWMYEKYYDEDTIATQTRCAY